MSEVRLLAGAMSPVQFVPVAHVVESLPSQEMAVAWTEEAAVNAMTSVLETRVQKEIRLDFMGRFVGFAVSAGFKEGIGHFYFPTLLR